MKINEPASFKIFKQRKVEHGTELVAEGSRNEKFFIIISGQVQIWKSMASIVKGNKKKKKIVLLNVQEGEIIGENSIKFNSDSELQTLNLRGTSNAIKPCFYSATVLSKTAQVYEIDASTFRAFFPRMLDNIYFIMS